MVEKCPCQTYVKSCCACVSMHCDECHGHSKFVQGRFCSNCGRPLKAELTPLYVQKSEVEKLEAENLILKQKRLTLFDRLEFVKKARADGAIEVIECLENEGLLNMTPQGIAELKEKYTEGQK